MARGIKKAILLAAGRGKRLGALTDHTPKPMLEVAGRPLLEHIIDALSASGVRDIALVIGYLALIIDKWSARYQIQHPDLRLMTLHQPEPTGTAGAMMLARDFVAADDTFIFGWGDILMDVENYARFATAARSEAYELMLAVNATADPWRGAAVYVDHQMRVERIVEKPARGTSTTRWNNAGLFASTPLIFEYIAKLKPSSRGELELPEAIAMMIKDGRDVRALDVRGFWSDIGTPEDLESARQLFRPPHRR